MFLNCLNHLHTKWQWYHIYIPLAMILPRDSNMLSGSEASATSISCAHQKRRGCFCFTKKTHSSFDIKRYNNTIAVLGNFVSAFDQKWNVMTCSMRCEILYCMAVYDRAISCKFHAVHWFHISCSMIWSIFLPLYKLQSFSDLKLIL